MAGEKKGVILKTAEYLFSTKGFEQTTVADIANEAGVHEASIYSYFNNKRTILFEINGKYLKNAIKTLNEHFQGLIEPGSKIRKSIWHFLYDMKNNPNYARLLMMAQRENPEFYTSDYYKYLKTYVKILLAAIEEGQKEGLFRGDVHSRLIRNLAMGASLFTTFDSIIHNHPYDPHEHSNLIYQLVINAVGAETVTESGNRKQTKKKRAEFRRAKILTTSTHVFANNGFSTATIAEIAKRAQMGDATLYGYFKNKEAILLAISEMHMQNLLSDENMIFKGLPKTEIVLRKLLWRWIWQLWTEKDFARILVLELFRNISFYSSKGYEFFSDFLDKIKGVVRKGQEEGIFIENVPFPTYLHMVVGTIDQYLLPQFLLNKPSPGLSELEEIVDALVRAIKVKNRSESLE